MDENFIPSVASRRYVRQLASHAPLYITDAAYDMSQNQWEGAAYRGRVHYSPTAGGDNTVFNRIKSGFPSAVIVDFDTNMDVVPVPFMASGVSFTESADGEPVVHYKLIKDLGGSFADGKPAIAIGRASDRRSVWIDFTVDYNDPEYVTSEDLPEHIINLFPASLREKLKKDLFIDLWNSACGDYGRYNYDTACFELNGLTDINYWEAIRIFLAYEGQTLYGPNVNPTYATNSMRTNIPFRTYGSRNFDCLFIDCKLLEVANLSGNSSVVVNNLGQCFLRCGKLKKILPELKLKNNKSIEFVGCTSLEDIKITISDNEYVMLGDSPKISLESMEYMITQAQNTAPVSIYVHPDVYLKIADGEWQSLQGDAAAKHITISVI